ncbi:tRNA-dependent cyclodipeptide synthase [Streptomyces sp. NPDC050743]|uniref:tRNA-dependent cyclodipeptide synthase n=1 Tax=Streptomyces sp. NPDC050743 TaxID=3365634 RepID=UPI003799AF3A
MASPLSTTCAEILSQADHACIGVSPFNSYFSVGRIRQLAEWAYERLARVDFFIPDGPSAYTLQALGYPPQRAEWKARRQGQYTRNRISNALRDLAAGTDDSRILGWAELQVDAAFVRLHAEVRARSGRPRRPQASRRRSGGRRVPRWPRSRRPVAARPAAARPLRGAHARGRAVPDEVLRAARGVLTGSTGRPAGPRHNSQVDARPRQTAVHRVLPFPLSGMAGWSGAGPGAPPAPPPAGAGGLRHHHPRRALQHD